MTQVTLGCDAMVEHHRVEVTGEGMTDAQVVALATQSGVNADGDRDMILARLSAVTHKTPLPGLRLLTCLFPVDMPVMEVATTVTISNGIWDNWTAGGLAASPAPVWVASTSPAVQVVLAEHYGCVAGAPADLEMTYYTENGPPGVGPDITPPAVTPPVPVSAVTSEVTP